MKKVAHFILVIGATVLLGCGGGGDTKSTNNSGTTNNPGTTNGSGNKIPVATIRSHDINEGTPSVRLNGSNSSDNDGQVIAYKWKVEDNSGYSSVQISNDSSSSVELKGLPVFVSQDVTFKVSLVVIDDKGGKSKKVYKNIKLSDKDGAGAVISNVDSQQFNGTWYSPCYNNNHNFSTKNILTVNGGTITSVVKTYANDLDCVLPLTQVSNVVIDADYRGKTRSSNCINNAGMVTNLMPTSLVINNGQLNYTRSDHINNGLALVTGEIQEKVFPDSTLICRKANGNLFFAGQEYKTVPNNTVVNAKDISLVVPGNDIYWKLGVFNFDANPTMPGSTTSNGIGKLIINAIDDSNRQDYEDSIVTLSYKLNGPGVYNLISHGASVQSAPQNSIHLSVITGNQTAAQYVVDQGGKVKVTVDNAGRYHFNIPDQTPIQLKKNASFSIVGTPNAPTKMPFSMNDLYDYSNDL